MGPLVVWWPRYHASLWYIDYCTHILSHWHFGVPFACVMIIESGTCYWSPTPPNYRNVFPSPCIMWAAIMSAGVSTKKGQYFPLLSWNSGMLGMSSYILIDLRYITVHYIGWCLNVSISQMSYWYDCIENSAIYYRRMYKLHLMVIMDMRVVLSDAYWNMTFLLTKWPFELLTLSVLLEFQYCNTNVYMFLLFEYWLCSRYNFRPVVTTYVVYIVLLCQHVFGSCTYWFRMYAMTSSNGSMFRVTGPLCREFIGDRWIPLTKSSDVELWCFLWSSPEQTAEWTLETPVIWDAITLIMTSLQWYKWDSNLVNNVPTDDHT